MNQLRKSALNLCMIAESWQTNADTSYDPRERDAWDRAQRWLLEVVEVLECGAEEVERT